MRIRIPNKNESVKRMKTMKRKKRMNLILCAAFLAGAVLSGCGTSSGADVSALPGTDRPKEAGIRIVTTIFPEYDWVKNVLGDNPADAEVVMLLDNGVDLHSYQPSAQDMVKISTCDLFVYVGGESDAWVEDALKEAVNPDMIVISLMDVLGDSVKEEEVVEGMQEEEHEHEHEHEEGEEHGHEEGEAHGHDEEEEEPEYDEHVWLSLRNACVLTEAILDAMEKIDPDHADQYRKNTEAFTEKCRALDADYRSTIDAAPSKTLLFGDRFPFRYLTDDYGLTYYAAFVGCSAETEASFETITFLAGKVDELRLPVILTIEGSDRRIAETIRENTKTKDQQILTLDSMQSVTGKDAENGTSYLSVMEGNLLVLKETLK